MRVGEVRLSRHHDGVYLLTYTDDDGKHYDVLVLHSEITEGSYQRYVSKNHIMRATKSLHTKKNARFT